VDKAAQIYSLFDDSTLMKQCYALTFCYHNEEIIKEFGYEKNDITSLYVKIFCLDQIDSLHYYLLFVLLFDC